MPRISSLVDNDRKLVRIGAVIRARRKRIGLSQEGLALLSGIERGNMGKIERGENNLSILNLVRIAEAIGATAGEILIDAKL